MPERITVAKGSTKRVLIVGGGVGGLALAAALGQSGIRSLVIERSSEHTVLGVGIMQPGNQLRALDAIGVLDECYAAGWPSDEWWYCDATGARLNTAPLLRIARAESAAYNCLPRPALQRVLAGAAARAGAEVRLGTTVQRVEETGPGVRVTLSDGSTHEADLLVGADGIRSSIRRLAFGGEFEPRYTGNACWRLTLPRPPEITAGGLYMGVHAKAGLVPITPDSMYLLLITPEPGNPRMPQERLHELLRERLAEFSGPVGRVRDAIRSPEGIVYSPVDIVTVPPPWHRGRIVLIGDAAHASPPYIAQGASMAIEDALVLAECLAKHAGLEAAFAEFGTRRYERCRFVQETTIWVGDDSHVKDAESARRRDEWLRAQPGDSLRDHERQLAAPI